MGGAVPRLEFPGGGQQDYCPHGTSLCLAWGREMQADVILKEPPSLSLSGGGHA